MRGASHRRRWTASEDRVLIELYPGTETATIAQRLGCDIHRVYTRARRLGLKKTEEYLASPAACRLRRGHNIGAATRFAEGHVPANRGLRRPGWAPGRMAETQFAKGELNGVAKRRHRPVGAERLIEGYVYVKIADVRAVPWTRNWKLKHVLLWERWRGRVPKGHAVAFRNGDRTDIRLANLDLVSRRELMRRNSVHNLPPELARVIQLKGALQRQINRRSG